MSNNVPVTSELFDLTKIQLLNIDKTINTITLLYNSACPKLLLTLFIDVFITICLHLYTGSSSPVVCNESTITPSSSSGMRSGSAIKSSLVSGSDSGSSSATV